MKRPLLTQEERLAMRLYPDTIYTSTLQLYLSRVRVGRTWLKQGFTLQEGKEALQQVNMSITDFLKK